MTGLRESMATPGVARMGSPSLAEVRPLPLRSSSEFTAEMAALVDRDQSPRRPHSRHKSTFMNAALARLTTPSPSTSRPGTANAKDPGFAARHRGSSNASNASRYDLLASSPKSLTPPSTPTKTQETGDATKPTVELLEYDFGKIDYELERARKLGSGLWSDVYLAEPRIPHTQPQDEDVLTPPATPQKSLVASGASVYAVKVPTRRDAQDVFRHEARMLTNLQRSSDASQYIVPFHGLDPRNHALIFEAVIGGSLEDLTKRLKQMTEVARHTELVSIFPRLAHDLVSGLAFIHEAGIVHADIKPANILLDISDHYSLPAPVIRARYIDFSASFNVGDENAAANAGGTWDFMAPEQMRLQKDLAMPTFASDVWSLGISLLSVIILQSPYTAASGGNMMRLREAIKCADPLGFARMDPVAQKRMLAVQEFIDCCRMALAKEREKRCTAEAWRHWLEVRRDGAYASLV